MQYAHQGVELKPIPFVNPPLEMPKDGSAVAISTGPGPSDTDALRASSLPAATSERLSIIQDLMMKASGGKPLAGLAPGQEPPLTEIAGSALPH
jgi:hypothetical protein